MSRDPMSRRTSDYQVLRRCVCSERRTRTRASTATHPPGPAITGFRSSSATSRQVLARAGRAGAQVGERRARRRRARRGSRRRAVPALPPVTSSSASTSVSGASRNCASPISSASAPPGPKATSGPKIGSWTTPGEQLDAAAEHRLHEHRRADPLGGRADLPPRRAGRARRRPISVLCAPARGGLDDDREPELAPPPRRPRRRSSATRSRTIGMP